MSQPKDNQINLKILSPEKEFYSGQVLSIKLQSSLGEIEILPYHSSLVSVIYPGYLTIYREGEDSLTLFLTNGYLDVLNNVVTIIADQVLKHEDVTKKFIDQQRNELINTSTISSSLSDREYHQKSDFIALYDQLTPL